MTIKNIFIWGIIGLYGINLMFGQTVRNQYYASFSFLFPNNTKQTQDLAEITRIICSIGLMISLLNVCYGVWFKIVGLISFVFYFVLIHNQTLLNSQLQGWNNLHQIILQILIGFFCFDSVVSQIVNQQMKVSRQTSQKQLQRIQNNKQLNTKNVLRASDPKSNVQQKKTNNKKNNSK